MPMIDQICSATNCEEIPARRLMCRKHWQMLPNHFQHVLSLTRSQERGETPTPPERHEAVRAAIKFVELRESNGYLEFVDGACSLCGSSEEKTGCPPKCSGCGVRCGRNLIEMMEAGEAELELGKSDRKERDK